MSIAEYVLMKNWIIAFIVFGSIIIVIINPSFITKYGNISASLNNIVRGFAAFILILWLIPHKSLLVDTLGYLKNGKRYVQSDICTVSEIQRTIWFFFVQKSIICTNGKRYVDRFTSRFYNKGDKLEIKYLPKATLIVNVRKLNK